MDAVELLTMVKEVLVEHHKVASAEVLTEQVTVPCVAVEMQDGTEFFMVIDEIVPA